MINAASSFDLELTNAILRGMKRRVEEGKAKGVLIHVTGVASFVDGSLTGSYVEGKFWNVSTLYISEFGFSGGRFANSILNFYCRTTTRTTFEGLDRSGVEQSMLRESSFTSTLIQVSH